MGLKKPLAVRCEDVYYIGCTAVAELDDIFVADFMQPVRCWEVFSQEVEEDFFDVSGNPVVIWGIKPNNFSSSLAKLVPSCHVFKR